MSDADKLVEQMTDRLHEKTREFYPELIAAARSGVLRGWRLDTVEWINPVGVDVKEVMVELDTEGQPVKFYDLRGHHALCAHPDGVLGVLRD